MQSAFLHYTNAGAIRYGLVVATHRLAFHRDFGVAQGHHCEKQRAGEPADHGAKRHEGKEHQHAAIAFKIAGFEDFDPAESCTDAKRGAAQRAEDHTQQRKQRDFMRLFSFVDAESPAVWSAQTAERFNAAAKIGRLHRVRLTQRFSPAFHVSIRIGVCLVRIADVAQSRVRSGLERRQTVLTSYR